jgi:hypothetical protein
MKKRLIIMTMVLFILLGVVSISYAQISIGLTGGWNFPLSLIRTDFYGSGSGITVENDLLDPEKAFYVGSYLYFSGAFHYMLTENAGVGINAGYTMSRWLADDENNIPETDPPAVIHIYGDFLFELPLGSIILGFHGGAGASFFMYERNVILVGLVDYGGIGFGFKGGVNVIVPLSEGIQAGINVDAHYFMQKTHVSINGGDPEENQTSSANGFFIPVSLYIGFRL